MRIGIDASNIRAGGGITHLVQLLRCADPSVHGFLQVIVWGGVTTLQKIEDRPWLVKKHEPLLDRGLIFRSFWQCFRLAQRARQASCDVLLVPGGTYAGHFRPVVTMSRNLLAFEWCELKRFGFSWMTIKLLMLRLTQSASFRRSDGLIFLTNYARDTVMKTIATTRAKTTVIPHGIEESFYHSPREQRPITDYSFRQPFRILYVSIIDVYKHQWSVAQAVGQLRQTGMPLVLELIGPAYPPALKHLRQELKSIDPKQEFVLYSGPVTYAELPACYLKADLFLFASSCENMPHILLEAMASGLPIASSNRGPMPEILKDAGIYFNPEDHHDIASAIKTLIDAPALRSEKAKASFEYAQAYSWSRCARETFGFLAQSAGLKT